MEHLALTYSGTVKSCKRLLEAGRPTATRGTEAGSPFGGSPGSGSFPKVANPKQACPKGDCGRGRRADDGTGNLSKMDSAIAM